VCRSLTVAVLVAHRLPYGRGSEAIAIHAANPRRSSRNATALFHGTIARRADGHQGVPQAVQKAPFDLRVVPHLEHDRGSGSRMMKYRMMPIPLGMTMLSQVHIA